jgi:hypothetical protein
MTLHYTLWRVGAASTSQGPPILDFGLAILDWQPSSKIQNLK